MLFLYPFPVMCHFLTVKLPQHFFFFVTYIHFWGFTQSLFLFYVVYYYVRWQIDSCRAGFIFSTHYLKMCRTGQMRQSSWLKSDRFVSCCQTFFFLPLFIPFHRKKPQSHCQAESRRTKIRQPLYCFNYNHWALMITDSSSFYSHTHIMALRVLLQNTNISMWGSGRIHCFSYWISTESHWVCLRFDFWG